MRRVANRLKRYRRVRGLSQKDVARIMGFKNSNRISRWEEGLAMPSARNVFKLAQIYRTMADALYMDLLPELKEEVLAGEDALAEDNRYVQL